MNTVWFTSCAAYGIILLLSVVTPTNLFLCNVFVNKVCSVLNSLPGFNHTFTSLNDVVLEVKE